MSKLRRPTIPLSLSLLALAVRLQNLTYHSLWFDEAMSVHWARSSLPRILEVSMNLVEDRLPPLYYLLLHYWRLLLGDGEFAVRLPSVLLGALLVPVVYRLASDLFDQRVGGLAAALVALNPFLVWYSQEARMYALAALLGTLGTWFFWLIDKKSADMSPRAEGDTCACAASAGERVSALGIGDCSPAPPQVRVALLAMTCTDSIRKPFSFVGVKRRSAKYWVAYGVCALAGLYTHLYTGFLLVAHALYLLLTHRRSRRAWLPFALTMLVVALLFSPLALAAWRASSEAGPGNPLAGFWTRTWGLLNAFFVWNAPLPALMRSVVTVGLSLLVGIGLVVTGRSAVGGRRSALLVALLLFTPFVIATLLLFRNQLAFFGQRYFIVMVPWLLIAVALGAVCLADWLRPARAPNRRSSPTQYSLLPTSYSLLPILCYLLPLALTLIPLPGQWSPPARKEAWRETVGYLAGHARPEDAILIHPDWTRFPLQYYFHGPGQTYAVFSSVDERTDLEAPLSVISQQHSVIWLVESHTELADPHHRVNGWLAARYPEVTELYPPGLFALRAYAPGYLGNALPPFATPVWAEFQGGVVLAGYVVPQTEVCPLDDLFHPPSGWVHVTLYWTADAPLHQDYIPFAHLIDDRGRVWGASLDRPNDALDFYPTSRWRKEEIVRLDLDVNLNPATPPGTYTLVVGLRDEEGERALLADGSSQATLRTVEVLDCVSLP